jgi:hypothetical protein
LILAASTPAQLAAQDRAAPARFNEQMRESVDLRALEPLGFISILEGQQWTPALADSSRYNWKAGWIGLGVGAAVGVALGAWAPGESGEGVYAPTCWVARFCWHPGFFFGLAIGNNYIVRCRDIHKSDL